MCKNRYLRMESIVKKKKKKNAPCEISGAKEKVAYNPLSKYIYKLFDNLYMGRDIMSIRNDMIRAEMQLFRVICCTLGIYDRQQDEFFF